MKHKIVVDKDGYLVLYRKKHWFSRWEYVEFTRAKSDWDPEYDGMRDLKKSIDKDNMKDAVVATYTNGVRDDLENT